MTAPDPPARRLGFGSYRGVALDVAVWDAVGADVDISFAGMFTRELGRSISGGLLHLDAALGGALLALRAEGVFRGDELETILLTTPPPPIRGRALMVIGLGDPEAWRAELMARATSCALSEAVRLGAKSASFAPGLLDSGPEPATTPNGAEAMLRGVVRAIDAQHRLCEAGLVRPPMLRQWTFGAGASHADGAVEQFRAALESMVGTA